jgi:hypothetical protein
LIYTSASDGTDFIMVELAQPDKNIIKKIEKETFKSNEGFILVKFMVNNCFEF